jgi:hypothetical protein
MTHNTATRAAPPAWARDVLKAERCMGRSLIASEYWKAQRSEDVERTAGALSSMWSRSANIVNGAVVRRLVTLRRMSDGERVSLLRECDGSCVGRETDLDWCDVTPWKVECARHWSKFDDTCWSCVVAHALCAALREHDVSMHDRACFESLARYFMWNGFA